MKTALPRIIICTMLFSCLYLLQTSKNTFDDLINPRKRVAIPPVLAVTTAHQSRAPGLNSLNL